MFGSTCITGSTYALFLIPSLNDFTRLIVFKGGRWRFMGALIVFNEMDFLAQTSGLCQ